jgi:hypothetical protein
MVSVPLVHEARNTTKSKGGEHFIGVIGLKNRTNAHQSSLVLVLRAEVMKTTGVGGLTIRTCEVKSYGERDLPPTPQILNERRSFFYLKDFDSNLSTFLGVQIKCFLCLKIVNSSVDEANWVASLHNNSNSNWECLIVVGQYAEVHHMLGPGSVLGRTAHLSFIN